MTIRRWVSPILITALLGVVAPADTWAAGAELATAKDSGTGRLHAAISRAASQAVTDSKLQMGVTQPAAQPLPGVRMKGGTGGGHTGMIIGLVTAGVGIAATVYAVKAMQKTEKQVQQGSTQ